MADSNTGPEEFLDFMGSSSGLLGDFFNIVANQRASKIKEADLRDDARFLAGQAQKQFGLAMDRAKATRTAGLEDTRTQEMLAGGSMRAGAAASGVRSDSGSVTNNLSFLERQGDIQEGRIEDQFEFSARSAALSRDQAMFQASEMVEAADLEADNRDWMLAGDIFTFLGGGIETGASIAMMAG